ncbi:uncharacterized protein LOC105194111 [Solenopsis invicta]|uniref:uncharacterized protein LOC105194111 n=1 Tax=Solenopsis invicta TaxID=13686 RepID=UPI00193E686D|nr:uncharacterized protein LOC105194111 [Solenopsis invicta]
MIEESRSQQTKRYRENSFHGNRKHTCILNDVRLYLERTSEGKSYFGLYNKQGFDNALRTDIAKYIISAELANDPNKRITPDDFRRLSQQIVQLFPMEIVLEQDFNYLYPNNSMQLLSNWEKIVHKLKKLLRNIKSASVEEETVKVLLAIPTFFSPTNVRKWRLTAADLSTGFPLHIKALQDLEVQVERMKQKLFAVKKQLQPFPIIIGKNPANITESYVYINNFPYKVESPLCAIDVCFKVYHALHAFYPFQSSQPCLFLQQAIYQFKTQWDEHVPSVATLVNDYMQLTDD